MARRKYVVKDPLILEVDTTGIDRMFDMFVADIEAAVRPAAQAGAQVLYDEVKRNVGQLKSFTGNLQKSIYQKYSPELSVAGQKAVYNISWNKTKAPHGWLVERGHMQRYRYYQNSQGQVRPMVRPGMDMTKKPGKSASQAAKDAYYVPLEGGPKHIAAMAFVRRAADKRQLAYLAMEQKLFEILSGQGRVRR